MANEFLVNRVAMGSFTLPNMPAASTASTVSASLEGLYIPSGAIVTRVGFVLGAQTEIASMENGTMQISVSNIPLLSNNCVASVALSVGAAKTVTAAAPGGIYIGTGGIPVLHLASSQAARSGISALGTVHIGYVSPIL